MARIIWADPAIQDLDAIADYIALERPAVAHELVRKVFAAVEMLQKFPRLGSYPTELRGLRYRQLIVSPCRIFYRIEKNAVYIVHVFRGEQLVRRELFSSRSRVSKSAGKRRPSRTRMQT